MCFLDADVLVRPHALAEHAVRAADGLVTLRLRQDQIMYDPTGALPAAVRRGHPNREYDPRVNWRAAPGPLDYSGLVLTDPVHARPIEDTHGLRALGYGCRYYDWDLPRMVNASFLTVPRQVFAEVGGFDPVFGRGWGWEDTFLGAKLIAAGQRIAPLIHAVGFHLLTSQGVFLASLRRPLQRRNLARYRRLLDRPPQRSGRDWFTRHTNRLLRNSEWLT